MSPTQYQNFEQQKNKNKRDRREMTEDPNRDWDIQVDENGMCVTFPQINKPYLPPLKAGLQFPTENPETPADVVTQERRNKLNDDTLENIGQGI